MSDATMKFVLVMFVLYVSVSALLEAVSELIRYVKRKKLESDAKKLNAQYEEVKYVISDTKEEGTAPEGGGRNVPDAEAPARAPRPCITAKPTHRKKEVRKK